MLHLLKSMKLSSRLGWLAALALFASPALAQESLLPVSRTAAVLTVSLPADKTTLVAVPMVKIVASGTIASIPGANQLTLNSSPASLPALIGPHAIKITSRVDQRGSGSNAPAGASTNAYGYSAMITAQAGQTVTAALAVAPNVDDEFVIYQTSTIASVFGAANSAGFTGAAAPATADIIYLGNSGALTGYFYHTTAAQWRLVNDPNGANQGDTEIGRVGGVLVARKAGGGAVSLTLNGGLLPGKTIVDVSSGFQVINNPYTVSTTLAASGLQNFVTGGTGAAVADILYLESNGVLTGYYFKTGGVGGTGWRSLADNITNQGAVLVSPGKAILFKEQAGAASFAMQEPFAE
jgi:hypothetical protein